MRKAHRWFLGVVLAGLAQAQAVAAQGGEGDAALERGSIPRHAQSQLDDVERFWSGLGDPVLEGLIARALVGNHEVRSAEARVEGAEASRLHAALGLAPIITAEAGYTRRRFANSAFPGLGTGVLPDESVWDSGLRASWDLDLFGRIRGDVHARSALAHAAAEDTRDTRVAVSAAVARAYFDLLGAREQLSVAERNAENQKRTLDLTLVRLDAGRGNEFDAARARAQLNSTLAVIPTLEADVSVAELRIATLMGSTPRELDLPEGGTLPELPEIAPLVAGSSLVQTRPDVLGAESRLAASRAMVGSARADYLPRLSLTAGAGYTARTFGAFGNTGTFNYTFGPVLSWAAFDIGRVRARVDEAEAYEREARAGYENAQLLALEELGAASVRYHRARERLKHLEAAAGASERAAELARLRYDGGIADFLQVLDAERTLLAAQDQLAQGRSAAATAYAALYEARGGVWEP